MRGREGTPRPRAASQPLKRAGAAGALLLAAAAASAADPRDAPTIRSARDAVYAMPEFQYEAPEGPSLLEEWFDAFSAALSAFARDHPTLAKIVIAAMALMLLAIVAHAVWSLRVARQAAWEDASAGDLDAAIRRGDPAPFRARAIEFARAGRYDEAVRDLYTALVLTLDRRGALRFASSKALLDYRLEAARQPDAAAALDRFAAVYHPGSFGRRPPDRVHFDALLADLDALPRRPE